MIMILIINTLFQVAGLSWLGMVIGVDESRMAEWWDATGADWDIRQSEEALMGDCPSGSSCIGGRG